MIYTTVFQGEKMFKKITPLALLLMMIVASTLLAGKKTISSNSFSGYVEVTNNTGYSIYYLYVSHTDEGWGDDVLGSGETLSDGESIRVDLDDYPSAIFDIKAEDEDGDTYTFWDVDVEFDDVEITIDDLDEGGSSSSYDELSATIRGTGKGSFDGYVTVTNETGYTVRYLYVSHTDDGWGDDVLGSDVLNDGQSIRVDVENFPSSIFDIKAEDEDDDSYSFFGIDIQYENVTIEIDDLD